MHVRSFITSKIDKIKNVQLEQCDVCLIDINLWFKSNELTPSMMNEVRQYIFEEWFNKKIGTLKNKILLGYPLVIVYDSPTSAFLDILKEKIEEDFTPEICDIILVD